MSSGTHLLSQTITEIQLMIYSHYSNQNTKQTCVGENVKAKEAQPQTQTDFNT